jgi:hypothetical protein
MTAITVDTGATLVTLVQGDDDAAWEAMSDEGESLGKVWRMRRSGAAVVMGDAVRHVPDGHPNAWAAESLDGERSWHHTMDDAAIALYVRA